MLSTHLGILDTHAVPVGENKQFPFNVQPSRNKSTSLIVNDFHSKNVISSFMWPTGNPGRSRILLHEIIQFFAAKTKDKVKGNDRDPRASSILDTPQNRRRTRNQRIRDKTHEKREVYSPKMAAPKEG